MKTPKFYKYSAAACAFAMIAAAAACSDAKGGNKGGDDERNAQRPDQELTKLMKSISDGDANVFASMCVYPIGRRYPLRSIEDSANMIDYFPILVDSNLKEKVRRSKIKDWDFYGWRGWALGDSTEIWYDDGVQFIDYESPAETGLRRILAREEIMSLEPDLRGDWTPVETMIETDGERIFRIDAGENGYRLLEYANADNMRGKPVLILMGSSNTEGSADYLTYSFSDSIGTTAEYSPDMEPPVRIFISSPKELPKEYKVKRGYWRDHLK